MSPRIKLSILLLLLAFILAFIPAGKYSMHGKPEKLLEASLNPETWLTADQVAKAIVTEDSTIQIIDLRSAAEFKSECIPGAINIPYTDFLGADLETFLNRGVRNVFYAEDDFRSEYAYVLATGLGFNNCLVMKGGLDGWYNDIMNSEFTGERITARENALFETRYRARNMFKEINSMPDSLKLKYRASLELERKKLDGGCE